MIIKGSMNFVHQYPPISSSLFYANKFTIAGMGEDFATTDSTIIGLLM